MVVTGAAGGVGASATAILCHRGFQVTASTGRPQEADYLTSLGASEIVERKEARRTRKTAGKTVLGGRCRLRRLDRARQHARPDALWRRSGDLWIDRRHRFADLGRAIYSTWCFAARDRVGHASDRRRHGAVWRASLIRKSLRP